MARGSFIRSALAGPLALLLFVWCMGCGRPSQEEKQQPAAVHGFIAPTNMIPVQPGSFARMGHQIAITHRYWLGKYEVTQREFIDVMGRNPSHFSGNLDCPVEKVSYVDAASFCEKLTDRERQAGRLPSDYAYRLPSEAEWEYACRAGTTNLFSFGETGKEAGPYAWTAENSEGKPHPVGQKLPNPWGFHDIHGNVWEWCMDWFAPYPNADLQDPAGPRNGKFKVFRGGGWNNDADFARSANRFMMAATNGIHFVGFRVALSPSISLAPKEDKNLPQSSGQMPRAR